MTKVNLTKEDITTIKKARSATICTIHTFSFRVLCFK